MIKFEVPAPTSTNALFRNVPGHGRGKTAAYKKWRAQADGYYIIQNLGRRDIIAGPYSIHLSLPESCRTDADNAIKSILDWCVSRGLVAADSRRHCRKVTIERHSNGSTGMCVVTLEPLVEPPS